MQSDLFQSSARRFRPQNFSDVIGQTGIIRTLKNSLKKGHVAHAYIFSGMHGTGKTTIARILAKALNCTNLSEDMEPCNQCPSCREITRQDSLDVIEIDGASNRGIDDIRSITETLPYNTGKKRYKIVIIDEVHMLTKEAFNALLKSLEEPPAHVKFFFATTEPAKIPQTIVSRCQRFDLQRIDEKSIIAKLEKIAIELGVLVEKSALAFIAYLAEGSMRSSESIFDQLASFSDGPITIESVQKLLGYPKAALFFTLDLAYETEDIKQSFALTDLVYESGVQTNFLLEALTRHFQTIVQLKLGLTKVENLLIAEQDQKAYQKASEIYSIDKALEILDFLSLMLLQEKQIPSSKVHLQMVFHRIIQTKNRLSLKEIQHILQNDASPVPHAPPQTVNSPTPNSPSLAPQTSKVQPKQKEPSSAPEKNASKPKHNPAYDTLMQFAAVELEGIILKNA